MLAPAVAYTRRRGRWLAKTLPIAASTCAAVNVMAAPAGKAATSCPTNPADPLSPSTVPTDTGVLTAPVLITRKKLV